jgi:hypothetical protein
MSSSSGWPAPDGRTRQRLNIGLLCQQRCDVSPGAFIGFRRASPNAFRARPVTPLRCVLIGL